MFRKYAIIFLFVILFVHPAFCQWKYFIPLTGGIDFTTPDTGLESYTEPIGSHDYTLNLNATTDGAQTWDTIYSRGPDEGLSNEGVFACRTEFALYSWINFQGSMTFYRTYDAKTLAPMGFASTQGPTHFISASFPDTSVFYLLCTESSDYIIKKYTHGIIYNNFYSFNLTGLSPSAIIFPDTSTGFIIGTSNGSDTNKILKSTDGGNNWQTILQIQRSIHCGFFINADTGYIALDSGKLLKTMDGANSWQSLDAGINAYINSLFFLNAKLGFASADNGIILRTTDGGLSWTEDITNTSDNFDKLFFVNSHIGFVATSNILNPALYEINLNLDTTSGVGNLPIPGKTLTIKLFPNPGTNYIQVQANSPIQDAVIFDIFGKEIMHFRIAQPAKTFRINLSGLSRGVYFLKVFNGAESGNSKVILR